MKTQIKINTKPLTGAALERYQKRMVELDKQFKPIVDAIRDSQRITSADLQKRVNV